MIEDSTLILSDGRTIAYARYGDPSGYPIGYCHGLPSSRLEAKLAAESAAHLGLQLIAIDRPGYGRSDPLPPSNIGTWPEDLGRVADHLKLDRLSVMGVSGGGPYALASGWRLGSRIERIQLVCPLGPAYLERLRDRMSPAARLAFFLASHVPSILPFLFGNHLALVLRHHPRWVISLMEEGLPEKDRQVLADPNIRKIFYETIREGLRQGSSGALRDFVQVNRPWGFALNSIRQPVTIWHGSIDTVVPLTHGRHLAEGLFRAEFHIVPKEGHYSLPVNHCKTILAACLQEEIGKPGNTR